MDILNKPIKTFSFDDIANFCAQGYVEGLQIDYKREIPVKGLAKHFAAFSNTRGGVIIVGVEEDKSTGVPKVWTGVKNEGKLVDRIHQFAANVEPLPSYEVHVTDEKDGNVFLLVRIFEGDTTPYYVQNDANLWVRTGNISNPIDIASVDAIELLFGKKEKAKLAREIYIKKAQDVYQAALTAILSLKNTRGALLKRLAPSRLILYNRDKQSLLPDYSWNFELDTALLNHDKNFQDFYINMMRSIYWSLGYEPAKEEVYKTYLKECGWLVEG